LKLTKFGNLIKSDDGENLIKLMLEKMLCRLAVAVLFGASVATAQSWNNVVTYPSTAFAQASTDYTVTVNGQPVFVEESRHISFVQFSFSGTATVAITYTQPIVSYELAPTSYGVAPTVSGSTLTFQLDVPRKMMLHNVNDPSPSQITDPRLLIFALPLEDNPPASQGSGILNVISQGVDNSGNTDVTSQLQSLINQAAANQETLYFPPGTYSVVSLNLASNLTMYLAGGARLHTNDTGSSTALSLLDLSSVSNIKIYGRGSLDGNGVFLRYAANGPHNSRDIIRSYTADNVAVDGLLLIDPSAFSVFVRRSQNWTLTNLALIDFENQDLGANAGVDGIDPDQSRNIMVDDVFIASGDDATSVKLAETTRWPTAGTITYLNSVFYVAARGSGLDMSDIDMPVTLNDVTWENIDVIGSLFGVTFFSNNARAKIQSAYVKNVRIGPLTASLIELNALRGNISQVNWDQVVATTYGPNGKGGKYGNFIQGASATQKVSAVKLDDFYVGGVRQKNLSQIAKNAFTSGISFPSTLDPVVTISATPNYALRQPSQPATVTVSRTGNLNASLTIGLTVSGSAVVGVDYQPIPSSVALAAGQGSTTFSIVPIAGGSSVKTVRIELNAHPFSLQCLIGERFQAVVAID
jgi:hypothetical protein